VATPRVPLCFASTHGCPGAVEPVLKTASHDIAAYLREAQMQLWDCPPALQSVLLMTCMTLRQHATGSLAEELEEAIGGAFTAGEYVENRQRVLFQGKEGESARMVLDDVVRGLGTQGVSVRDHSAPWKDTLMWVHAEGVHPSTNADTSVLYVCPLQTAVIPRWSTSSREPWMLQGWHPANPTLLHPLEAHRLALLGSRHPLSHIKVVNSEDWLEVISKDPSVCASFLRVLARPPSEE